MSREPFSQCSSLCVNLTILFLYDDTLRKLGILHASLTFFVLQQQQNLGLKFGTSKMHLSPQWLWLLSVVLLLLICCCLLLPFWDSVIVLCFVVCYFVGKYHNHKLQTNPWHREEEPHSITRQQEDKQSKATSSLFPIEMIAKLEWIQSNAQHINIFFSHKKMHFVLVLFVDVFLLRWRTHETIQFINDSV